MTTIQLPVQQLIEAGYPREYWQVSEVSVEFTSDGWRVSADALLVCEVRDVWGVTGRESRWQRVRGSERFVWTEGDADTPEWVLEAVRGAEAAMRGECA